MMIHGIGVQGAPPAQALLFCPRSAGGGASVVRRRVGNPRSLHPPDLDPGQKLCRLQGRRNTYKRTLLPVNPLPTSSLSPSVLFNRGSVIAQNSSRNEGLHPDRHADEGKHSHDDHEHGHEEEAIDDHHHAKCEAQDNLHAHESEDGHELHHRHEHNHCHTRASSSSNLNGIQKSVLKVCNVAGLGFLADMWRDNLKVCEASLALLLLGAAAPFVLPQSVGATVESGLVLPGLPLTGVPAFMDTAIDLGGGRGNILALEGGLLLAMSSLSHQGIRDSIDRTLGLMVAASRPLAYATAISACANKGIFLEGGEALDALARCDSVGDGVKPSEAATSEESRASTSKSDPPTLESIPPSPSNPFASGKISKIAAQQAGNSNNSVSGSIAQKAATPVKKPAAAKSPAVGQLSANAAAQLKVSRNPSVFTVPTKPTDGKPSSPFAKPTDGKSTSPFSQTGPSKPTAPTNPFRKAPLVPDDWEKAGARPAGSGKRVLEAFKEGEKEGNTTKFGLPVVPSNIFDEVRRTPEEIAADAFKFEISPGQLFLAASFLVVISIMFGTVFLVWKVGAIHYNEF